MNTALYGSEMELEFEDGSTLDPEQMRDMEEWAAAMGMTLEEFIESTVRNVVKPQLEAIQEWQATHSQEEVETAMRMHQAMNESERAGKERIRNQIRDALNE